MKRNDKIRKEIFKKTTEFYKLRHHPEKFVPGKTDIRYGGRVYDEKEMVSLVDSALDFWLTAGRYAKAFEERLAAFLGVKCCLLVNSGSSANLLAASSLTSPLLRERRLRAGDEVITTACGFPTTLNPIIQNNLIPVFVDIDLGTYNIRTDQIERAITKKTRAIFVAHTLGNPINIAAVLRITKRHNLFFVEDNCDALGSKYRGKYTGAFGHLSTCSFYPAHHITMGEGGAVLTNDSLIERALLSLRDWGRDCWCSSGHDNTCKKRFSQKFANLPYGYDHKYVYSHIGYNMKITDMQAAVGIEQLKKLPQFIKARNRNFRFLYGLFRKYDRYFMLPKETEHSKPSWFGFPLLVREKAPFAREDIVGYLEKNRIATRMLFGGNLTKQPAYKDIKYRIASSLVNTDLVMDKLFWIGVYPGITKEKLSYIAKIVEEFL